MPSSVHTERYKDTYTRSRVKRLMLSLCVVGVSVAGVLTHPAHASTDHEPAVAVQPFVTPLGTRAPASDQHVTAFADELGDTAADVLPLVSDTISSLGRNDGYAGQSVSPDKRSIDVYWKGALPEAVSSYIAGNGRNVTVRVHETAVFTRAEEKAAAARVAQSGLADRAGITGVSANHDGSGITVHLAGTAPSAEVRRQIARTAGMAAPYVSYEEHAGELVPLTTRANDAAPWSGGGRIITNGQACSTGFSVLSGVYGRILSANHCDPRASSTVRSGGGTTMATGSGVSGLPSIDSQSINPIASPATAARIYLGPWNSRAIIRVRNWASNSVGDYVCSGGASTGSHCGTVTHDAVAIPGLTGGWYIRARASGSYMAGGGDSGGPIYRTVSEGVQARGTLIGGVRGTERSCGSHNPDVRPTCYRDILYLPISVALNSWGYALEVG